MCRARPPNMAATTGGIDSERSTGGLGDFLVAQPADMDRAGLQPDPYCSLPPRHELPGHRAGLRRRQLPPRVPLAARLLSGRLVPHPALEVPAAAHEGRKHRPPLPCGHHRLHGQQRHPGPRRRAGAGLHPARAGRGEHVDRPGHHRGGPRLRRPHSAAVPHPGRLVRHGKHPGPYPRHRDGGAVRCRRGHHVRAGHLGEPEQAGRGRCRPSAAWAFEGPRPGAGRLVLGGTAIVAQSGGHGRRLGRFGRVVAAGSHDVLHGRRSLWVGIRVSRLLAGDGGGQPGHYFAHAGGRRPLRAGHAMGPRAVRCRH